MQQLCELIRRLVAPAIVLAACAAIAAGQVVRPAKPASDGRLKASVERLIGDLDSKSRGVRVRAERDLLALGPRILPLLPPSELTPNVSVREAVRRVRIRLENVAARDSVQPSQVVLTGMWTLSDLLLEIAKQTGNVIDGTKLSTFASGTKIDVAYSGATFWAVMDDLARRGKLRVRVVPGENRMTVEARSAKPVPTPLAADTRGAFRIAILSIQKRPIVGDAANRLLRVRWSITAEPRLRPLFMKYGGRSLIAETAVGKPLAPFDRDASLEVTAVDGAAAISQTSDFILPKVTAAASIRFRGQVKMLTAARSEPVAFRDLSRAKGQSVRRGGVTVTVNGVTTAAVKTKKAAAERVSVDVSISYDAEGPAFESHRTWIFHNRVYLETAGGQHIPADPAFKTIVQRDGAVGVTYGFAVLKSPLSKLKFVYVAPTLLIDVPIKFDFPKLSLIPRKPARSSK